jgi:hypothetical protein
MTERLRFRHRTLARLALAGIAVLLGAGAALGAGSGKGALHLGVDRWRIVERKSGPVNYYTVVKDPERPFIRGAYRPPYETAVLGVQIAKADQDKVRRLVWRWRAMKLPKGGDECVDGKGDSAAVVYVTWRRGLRWYTLKYVWSALGKKGAICDRKRNPFVAQDTIILRSGAPLGTWQDETIDLRAEFRKHFEDGDPNASVPPLLGIGLMTDGDQTQSESAADYAGFALIR